MPLTPEQEAKMDLLLQQKGGLHGAKEEAQGRVLSGEIVPATSEMEWSAHDPACMDEAIRKCIQVSLEGARGPAVFAKARDTCKCPLDVWEALRRDTRWTVRYRQLVQEEVVLPNLAVATNDAMQDGGAYGMAQSLNTAPKDDYTEDERRRAAAYAAMGPKELEREISRRQAVLKGFEEKLAAGRSPPPERVAQIQQEVVSVMDPPKRLPRATEE